MRIAVIVLAVVVLGGAGWFEMHNATRRADPVAVARAQERLDAIPMAVGDWVGERQEYDLKQHEKTGAFAALSRGYRNGKTGDAVGVLILAGPATDIGAHDPNRCYEGSGYRPVGPAARRELPEAIPAGPCAYWSARFDTDTFPAASLQVNWAWSLDGRWAASDDARYDFGRQPVLFKLYASRRVNPAATSSPADPTEAFLTAFFPAVRAALTSN